MKFLILSQYFPPEIGASQTRLAGIARELKAHGHEVEVVTAVPNYPEGKIRKEYRHRPFCKDDWEGITVHRVWVYPATGAGARRLINYLSFAVTSLIGLIRARRPDYLLVNSPPLFTGIPAFIMARLWRRPFIFCVADMWPDSVSGLGLMKEGPLLKLARGLEGCLYRKATYVSAVTEGIRQTLLERKRVPRHKVVFLPNGVDTDLFRPREPDEKLAQELGLAGRNVVLYAGTYGYAHGIEVVFRAAEKLRDENVEFIFVGNGSDGDRVLVLANDMKLSNVRFLPPAPPEYIARLLSISCAGLSTLRDVSLFADRRPAKIFPILGCGKPVLYSGAGEGAELIRDARAGIVTPPGDAAALAGAVKTIIANPDMAAQMGASGRKYIEDNLSWPLLVSDWLRQLESHQAPRSVVTPIPAEAHEG